MESKKIWEVHCKIHGKRLIVAKNVVEAIEKAIGITNSMRKKGVWKTGPDDIERCELIGEAWD